uniref:Type III secretion system flagellar brake protein YcgR PilZN domain-containing protein n=1 Tax=Pseudomonas putida TaxID=303 RepID=E0D4A9_PSEPU|nr:conserved hypothetical protein [Pseudomonas putida]
MFNASIAEDTRHPPNALCTLKEISGNLRQLLDSHDPLIITSHERSQRFQSYLVDLDRERNMIALDEMIPRDGERFLLAGEPFRVEGFHEGVRIAWESNGPLTIDESNFSRCYRGTLPDEVVSPPQCSRCLAASKRVDVGDRELGREKLKASISGKLLDISATGCKLRFEGDITGSLQLGQVYDRFNADLPFGKMTAPVELRYLHHEVKIDGTFASLDSHHMIITFHRQVQRF